VLEYVQFLAAVRHKLRSAFQRRFMEPIFDHPEPSSATELARRLVELRRQRDLLILRSLEQCSLPSEQREDLRKERLVLEARIEVIEAAIISRSPASLTEVAVQLMAALQHVDDLISYREGNPGEIREIGRVLERVLVAAIRRIEANEPLDLMQLGGPFYLKGRAVAENYEHLWAEIVAANFNDMYRAFRDAGEEYLETIPPKPTTAEAGLLQVDVRRHPMQAAADWQRHVLDLWRRHPWPQPGFLKGLKSQGWLDRCVFLSSAGEGRPLAFQFIGTPTIKILGTDWARSQLGRSYLADPHADLAYDLGEQYREAIETGEPIYNRVRITGLPDQPVDYSHLLLGWTLPGGRQALLTCVDLPA
jgi:hypothetical protein